MNVTSIIPSTCMSVIYCVLCLIRDPVLKKYIIKKVLDDRRDMNGTIIGVYE